MKNRNYPLIVNRRRFMTAMGLGGAALSLPGMSMLTNPGRALAQPAGTAPTRVIFWITPHGTVWNHWNMNLAGLSSATSRVSLSGVADSQFSEILAPLAPHKNKIQIVEGVARTQALEYERAHDTDGGYDLNRHDFGQATLMTCVEPMQRSGTTCTGGGESIDQTIARAVAEPGRFASRVYGGTHYSCPYSFVARGEDTGRTEGARQAFDDIAGMYTPPAGGGEPVEETRASRIQRARGSVLDFAAGEHSRLLTRLGTEARAKLQRHQQLIRDLELSFDVDVAPPPAIAACNPSWAAMGHQMDQFSRVTALALACDMTRVVTYATPILAPSEIGLPSGSDIHQDYAHNSIRETASAFSTEAERGMVEFNQFYAERFAYLLAQLDSIPEGDGTVLDHTAVVWMSELGTGTHELHDLPIVVAGGASGALRTGQYVRYARDSRVGAGWGNSYSVGPSQNQLFVTLMRAMGMSNGSFGLDSVSKDGGGTLSLTGPLTDLLV